MNCWLDLRILLSVLAGVLAGCSRLPDDSAPPSASAIRHLVVVIQENHTFDNYFGRYCTAAPGSSPRCDTGPACCEAAPIQAPGTGDPPTELTDEEHAAYSPNHNQDCEVAEINGGRMDRFILRRRRTAPSIRSPTERGCRSSPWGGSRGRVASRTRSWSTPRS